MSTEEHKPTSDEAMGMAWWNSISEEHRAAWAAKAGTGVVADAWTAFKSNADAEIRQLGIEPEHLQSFITRGMSIGHKRGG